MEYKQIDVYGKTAEQVAEEIKREVITVFGWKGGVVVLVGLSGVGKGTTVDTLKKVLPDCTTWSNGNIFRCITLLAVTRFATRRRVQR